MLVEELFGTLVLVELVGSPLDLVRLESDWIAPKRLSSVDSSCYSQTGW